MGAEACLKIGLVKTPPGAFNGGFGGGGSLPPISYKNGLNLYSSSVCLRGFSGSAGGMDFSARHRYIGCRRRGS